MTTAQHDDVATTAVEDALARLDTAAAPADPSAARPHLATVDTPSRPSGRTRTCDDDRPAEDLARTVAATAPAAAPRSPRPRLRLVPALPPVRPAVAPAPAAPAALGERARRGPVPVALRAVADDHDDDRGAVPTIDAGRFVHGVGLACVEVVLGRRPVAQLARWVTPDVLEELQVRADLVRRTGVLAHARRPAARRVRVCPVDAHTAEACLVVDDGVRVRALAARLEAHRGSWRVTTLQLG